MIYLRYSKPIYESFNIIQLDIKNEGQKVLDMEGVGLEENKLAEDVELLKSTFLATKALKNLEMRVSYFSEGNILTEERYKNAGYSIIPLEIIDSSIINVPITINKFNSNQISISYKMGGESFNYDYSMGQTMNTRHFKALFKLNDLELLKSNIEDNRVFFKFNSYEKLAKKVVSNLQINVLNPDAKTIRISYRSTNPTLSRDIVVALTNAFNQFDLERKSKSSQNILDFINNQIDTVFINLKESESQIQEYRKANKITDPEQVDKAITERISKLENDLISAEIELQLIREIKGAIDTNSSEVDLYNILPLIIGSQYESSLYDEMTKLQELINIKEKTARSQTEKSFNFVEAKKNVARQVKVINKAISVIEQQLNTRREMINDKISLLKGEHMDLPEKQMELSRLSRHFNLNEEFYMLLLNRKIQYSISKAGFTPSHRTLEEATIPTSPVSPNTNLIYISFSLFGGFIGIFILFIRYITFNEILDEEDLKQLLPPEVGFIGSITTYKKKIPNSQIVVINEPKSMISESFRNIRTNLEFISPEKQQLIAISSTTSGEGKTFAALNIAGILSITDQKVIVIDLDMRKPKIHLGFENDNKLGMSTLLIGKNTLDECINKSAYKNLDYITAGPIPPNPSELVMGKSMKTVLDKLKERYDRIIIDNPPVGLVSDGIYSLNSSDCPLYIFRANYSKREFVKLISSLIEGGKVKKLFVILNGAKISSNKYGYGYGGYYEESEKTPFWRKIWKK